MGKAASPVPALSEREIAFGYVAPPSERGQHGRIERPPETIADELGNISRPYRCVDTLTIMQRRGSITGAMRQAGEDFRRQFQVAGLDPLKAADVSRPFAGGAGKVAVESERIEAARNAVWKALCALGGMSSPSGSCAWRVLGLESSIKEWAIGGWHGRPISQESASGILIGALGALQQFYHLT